MAEEIVEKMKAQKIKFTSLPAEDGMLIVDLIAKRSPLSKSVIKSLMVFGAAFQTINSKRKRVRKAKTIQKTGNIIECYFDPKIDLNEKFEFKNLYETSRYGVYLKPAGALTEGTDFGDQTSLFRHVEKHKKFANIVNRVDRETEGLVIVAYDSKTQNLFQEMWREKVTKKYQAIVLGRLEGSGEFTNEINKKFTKTEYQCLETESNKTKVDISLKTERKHQIRIHFSEAGHPVIGDPIYGEKNKNRKGLKLVSYSLEFIDPYSKKEVKVLLPEDKLLFSHKAN
jgi:tRNA pseudouridine32 synthase/23S rRNA pseudouridine746 synthase